MESYYETRARDAGLKDRFGDGWEAVCKQDDCESVLAAKQFIDTLTE